MKKITQFLSNAGINGFFFCLIGMVILAWLYPAAGIKTSPLHLDLVSEYGVSVIFFFYGLKLSPEKLKAGLSNWKLHILVQLSTFILFPVIVIIVRSVFATDPHGLLWIGIFYLAALPSTVSSSVVMVSIARGNVPAAIFNASISSIIGIFITPIWMSTLLRQSQADFNIGNVILRLCLEVLLPVIIGIALNRKWGKWASKHNATLRYFDQTIILLIVYTSFCESFYADMFSSYSGLQLTFLGSMMLLFFLVVFVIMYFLARLSKFNRGDTITLLFCGSKKSLVQGAVMGKVLFPDPMIMGVVLLPLMLYHALQLLAGSAIAEAMGKKKPAAG